MKKALALFGALLLMALWQRSTPAAAEVRHGWEYATLSATATDGRIQSWGFYSREYTQLERSREDDGIKAQKALTADLGGNVPLQGDPVQPLLDAIGGRGWELVSSGTDQYVFKRPKN